MSAQGEIVPAAARIRRVLPAQVREAVAEPRLSRKARGRLYVLRWSEQHGGAVRATCGRFGWSTSTFLHWRARHRRLGEFEELCEGARDVVCKWDSGMY